MLRWVAGGSAMLFLLGVAAQPLPAQPASLPAAFGTAAQAVMPAIVEISIPLEADLEEMEDDDAEPTTSTTQLLEDVFGDRLQPGRRTVAIGVVLDPRGFALTSARRLRGARDLVATTRDGVPHPAVIIGTDDRTDVAVIRLRGGTSFPHASLADSDRMRIGDWVVAVGNPYGLGISVTAGILGATGRPHPMAPIDEWFQTDAFTYADSAGGPLVDLQGRVVAFATIVATAEVGVGFAIPSNLALPIYRELVERGRVLRSSLDVRVQSLTDGLVEALGVRAGRGLLVSEVVADGAGARAGLQPGDVLLALDGAALDMPYDLDRALRVRSPGQRVTLAVWRQSRDRTVQATLGTAAREPLEGRVATRAAAMLGFEVRPLTPDFGVVVARVDPAGEAAAVGLRPGDLVREVSHQTIRTMTDFQHALERRREGGWLAMLIQRGQVATYVAVPVGHRAAR